MKLVYKGIVMVAPEVLEVYNWRMLQERSEGLSVIDIDRMRE